MSEIVSTLLMTGLAVVLVGGFSAVVLSGMANEAVVAPTGVFTIDAVPGARSIDAKFVSGQAFPAADLGVVLKVDDTSAATTHAIVQASVPQRFSPGDVLRVALSPQAPDIQKGTRFTLYLVHAPTGDLIGTTHHEVPTGASPGSVQRNALGLAGATFDPPTLAADARRATNVSVRVASSMGARLVDHVTLRLQPLGGGDVTLLDSGHGADAVAGDGIFTATFTPPQVKFERSDGVARHALTVLARDVFGNTASASATLTLTAPPQSKVALAAKYRDVVPSARAGHLNLTNFTFQGATQLDGDVVELRASDLTDASRAWVARIAFAHTACGARPGVTEVRLLRDGLPGSVTYTPSGDCFPVDAGARLALANVAASREGTGATRAWTVAGDEATFRYASAGIGNNNEVTVTFFGDAANSGPAARGLGQADLTWAPGAAPGGGGPPTPPPPPPNQAPTAAIRVLLNAGKTVHVDATGSADADGTITKYAWTWGDGTPDGTQATATHTYATTGTKTITLVVTDDKGATGSANVQVQVTGFTWFTCPPSSVVDGTVTACAALQSATDAQAAASFGESGKGNQRRFEARFVGAGSPSATEAARAHALELSARQGTAPEALHVQVSPDNGATWTTVITLPVSQTSFGAPLTAPLTQAQWNNGAPRIRFIDATSLSGARDAASSTWIIDYVRVVTT